MDGLRMINVVRCVLLGCTRILSGGMLLSVFCLISFVPSVHAAPVDQSTSSNASAYVHTATAANVAGDWTDLNNPLSNNNPSALVFVTPNWNPNGAGGTYYDHPLGVWYHDGKWAIFSQDIQPIPVGASFNVVIVPNAGLHTTFIHRASSSNVFGNYTDLDNLATNKQPNAVVLVTPNWNPYGVNGTYNNHPLGVWYHNGKWAIFNQDLQSMPVGAAFNVMVFSFKQPGVFKHTALANTIVGNWTNLSSSVTNGKAHALVFVTPVYNPNSVYVNHNLGVWYTPNQRWAIFNQDLQNMLIKATFNVVVF